MGFFVIGFGRRFVTYYTPSVRVKEISSQAFPTSAIVESFVFAVASRVDARVPCATTGFTEAVLMGSWGRGCWMFTSGTNTEGALSGLPHGGVCGLCWLCIHCSIIR